MGCSGSVNVKSNKMDDETRKKNKKKKLEEYKYQNEQVTSNINNINKDMNLKDDEKEIFNKNNVSIFSLKKFEKKYKKGDEKKKYKKRDEKKLDIELKILLINLEAKHADAKCMMETLEELYQKYIDKSEKNPNINYKEEIIQEIYDIFNKELQLKNEKENNDESNYKKKEDIKHLKDIISFIYDEYKDEFFDYLKVILEHYIDFSALDKKDEDKICNYIMNYMKSNMKDKNDKLKGKYKDNHIIKLNEFVEIILDDNEDRIFMENEATEYLIYKMKKQLFDDKVDNVMDAFDIKVFLDFYDKEIIE